MRVVIAGGHGQIALLLERLLAERGDSPVGIVRNPDHVARPRGRRRRGGRARPRGRRRRRADRGGERRRRRRVRRRWRPDSGAARKETVDKGAAVLLADAAEQAGVRRYVMVSSMGTDKADPDSDDVFQVYLRAKLAADDDLRARDLDWTVVRPGRLTDDARHRPGPGRHAGAGRDHRAPTWPPCSPRCSSTDTTIGKTFDLLTGAPDRSRRPSPASEAASPVSR